MDFGCYLLLLAVPRRNLSCKCHVCHGRGVFERSENEVVLAALTHRFRTACRTTSLKVGSGPAAPGKMQRCAKPALAVKPSPSARVWERSVFALQIWHTRYACASSVLPQARRERNICFSATENKTLCLLHTKHYLPVSL